MLGIVDAESIRAFARRDRASVDALKRAHHAARFREHGAAPCAVYGNRRRIRGRRGKALLRSRGELFGRPFAHGLETGAMRRMHLRRHENILKRLLVHVSGLNLGLLMRKRFGVGTPCGLQGRRTCSAGF
jgi:hypothetical protein